MDKIVTKRLILRGLESKDSTDIFEYAKLDIVGPAAGWQPHKTEEETKKVLEWMIKSKEIWAIVLKESGKTIGSIGLHKKEHKDGEREIGYVLNPQYWHEGFMHEAVVATIMYAFDHLSLEKLHCAHFEENDNSRKVIEKAGFKKICQSKTTIYLFGFQVDKNSVQYELEKMDYERNLLPWQHH